LSGFAWADKNINALFCPAQVAFTFALASTSFSKTEKLFYNSGICNGYYYCKFVIRDCDTFMFDTNVALGTAFVRGNSIAEFQTFINNKKPQLQK
jgi:hypothetical protein